MNSNSQLLNAVCGSFWEYMLDYDYLKFSLAIEYVYCVCMTLSLIRVGMKMD